MDTIIFRVGMAADILSGMTLWDFHLGAVSTGALVATFCVSLAAGCTDDGPTEGDTSGLGDGDGDGDGDGTAPQSSRAAISEKLRACGDLGSGFFWWEENGRDGDDACWLGCVAEMECSDIANFLCSGGAGGLTLDKKNAFIACAESCTGAQECSDSSGILPGGWVCDGIYDCGDYSDEAGACPLFECEDGSEISQAWVCDSFVDCIGGEDELNCEALSCGDAGANFYPTVTRCNGVDVCPNGTDEDGCAVLDLCPDRYWGSWIP